MATRGASRFGTEDVPSGSRVRPERSTATPAVRSRSRCAAARRRSPVRCRRDRGRPPCGLRWSASRSGQVPDPAQRSRPRGHQDRRDGFPCAIGVLNDVDRPIFGKRPHRLRGVGEERRLAQQPLVPRPGRMEVTHTQTREEVQRHCRESRRAAVEAAPLELGRPRSHPPARSAQSHRRRQNRQGVAAGRATAAALPPSSSVSAEVRAEGCSAPGRGLVGGPLCWSY
jgi:hypothetical protein